MKRFFGAAAAVWLLFAVAIPARAARALVPVGQVIAVQLRSDTVTVVAYDETLGHCAREAGLKIGDEILSMDGVAVESPRQLRDGLTAGPLALTVRRNGRTQTLTVTPQATADGPRLGVCLRQGIAGIGTVTFFDPETGLFGALGHGVADGRGSLLPMRAGTAWDASVLTVVKGKAGQPGQLKGEAAAGAGFAGLTRNTPQGIFGITGRGWAGDAMPTAAYSQIRTGPATVRCQISGTGVRDYEAEILKIYPQTRPDGRNFLIRITDQTLLTATGGIVQGMSGSPIIQDGKLVGAVTHVLVNDPTRGYGIFIENMLDAAG